MSYNNSQNKDGKIYPSSSSDIRTIPQQQSESQVRIDLPESTNTTKSQPNKGGGNINFSINPSNYANTGLSDATIQQLTRLAEKQKVKQQNTNNSGNNWGLGYLAQYFDVTTDDVLQRIIWSVIPLRKAVIDLDDINAPLASNMISADDNELFSPSSSDQQDGSTGDRIVGKKRYSSYIERYIESRPDIYGPFWICITLIFSVAIFSNLTSFVEYRSKLNHALDTLSTTAPSGSSANNLTDAHHPKNLAHNVLNVAEMDWHYSVEELNMAASLVTSYVLMIPLLIWSMFWFGGYTRFYTLTETICAYGYSISIFIPISMLFIVQETFIRYTLIALGSLLSGYVLMLSFYPIVQSDSKLKGSPQILLLALPGLQFLLGYVLHRIMLQPN